MIAAVTVLLVGPQAGAVFAESDDNASFWRAEQMRKNVQRQASVQRQTAVQRQPQAQTPAAQRHASAAQRHVPAAQRREPAPQRQVMAYAPVPQPRLRTSDPFWFFTQPGGPAASLGAPGEPHFLPDAHSQIHRLAQPRSAHAASQTRRADFSPRPPAATSRMVCVRLCDGFFFPAPAGAGASDAGCAAMCPNAPTRLYSMRTDRIVDAVSARDGALYANLPVALRYTRTRDQSCSCGAPDPRAAILADSSLRRGDRFMTSEGFVIYRGRSGSKVAQRDFTPLAKAQGVPRAERALLAAMERVSVPRPAERLAALESGSLSHVALGPPPTPVTLR